MAIGKLSRTGFTLKEREVEGYYTKKVTPFGNGAKIDSFLDFVGHDAIVVILKR